MKNILVSVHQDGYLLFYTIANAYILQNGHLSKPFNIERGCRQGDALSPYLFTLGVEILGILDRTHSLIKGIDIEVFEYKIGQFAVIIIVSEFLTCWHMFAYMLCIHE